MLFLLATVLSGQAVLPRAHHTDIYLTALGALLTDEEQLGTLLRLTERYCVVYQTIRTSPPDCVVKPWTCARPRPTC